MAYSGTVNSDIATVWRKVQGDLQDGINFKCEEMGALSDDIPQMKIPTSLREMTYPVRLSLSGGITTTGESGRLANPTASLPVDATVAFIHKDGRFTISQQAQWVAMGGEARQASIMEQLKYQGMDKVDSLAADVADRFWGFSNGVVATTTTAATQSSGTYVLTNGYGLSSITDTTFLASKFVPSATGTGGDWVALVRAGALVTNAIGYVTASTTSGIAVTWQGSVTSLSGDTVVKANGANPTSIAHTSYNKDMTGLLDMATSTSLHGISGATYPNWTAAWADTTGGRFNGVKLRKGFDQIANNSGSSKPRSVVVWAANGVLRDVIAQQSAGLRFDNPFALEMDGDVKARGKMFQTSRRVPPGLTYMYADGAIRKKVLKEADGAPAWGDLYVPQDDSYLIGRVDFALLTACTSRKSIAYWSGLTES